MTGPVGVASQVEVAIWSSTNNAREDAPVSSVADLSTNRGVIAAIGPGNMALLDEFIRPDLVQHRAVPGQLNVGSHPPDPTGSTG